MKAALDEAGVEMPEPTYRVVQMPSSEPPASGERKEVASSAVRDQARSVDVARDGRLEAQVDAEAHDPDEPNFLDE